MQLTMKEWRMTQAERDRVTESAISMRLRRGFYRDKIKIHRRNKRVVFVEI